MELLVETPWEDLSDLEDLPTLEDLEPIPHVFEFEIRLEDLPEPWWDLVEPVEEATIADEDPPVEEAAAPPCEEIP